MGPDPTMRQVLSHYAPLVLVSIILGALLGVTVGQASAPRPTAWTIVLDAGNKIPASQFGWTAEALFASSQVRYGADARLGLTGTDPDSVTLDLVPVADTRAVVVQATAATPEAARAAADSGADSLVYAFRSSGFTGFDTLSVARPAVDAGAISPSVATAAGVFAGFWLGVALSWLHLRIVRPVLDPNRAATVVHGLQVRDRIDSAWRWLGVFRPQGVTQRIGRGRGPSRGRVGTVEPTSIVAGPGTSESALFTLREARSGSDASLTWVE